jgi:hypothetical protein
VKIELVASNPPVPYTRARGIGSAIEENKMKKGILSDSKIVEVCQKLFREKRLVLGRWKGDKTI